MILRQRSKPLRSALESVYQKEVPQRRGRAGGWSKGRRSCSKKDGCSQGTFSFSPNIWAFLLGGVRLTALWHGWGKAVDSSGDGSSEAWARAAEVLLRASVDTRRLLELEQHLRLFFSYPISVCAELAFSGRKCLPFKEREQFPTAGPPPPPRCLACFSLACRLAGTYPCEGSHFKNVSFCQLEIFQNLKAERKRGVQGSY